jgi:hypothetical protein
VAVLLSVVVVVVVYFSSGGREAATSQLGALGRAGLPAIYIQEYRVGLTPLDRPEKRVQIMGPAKKFAPRPPRNVNKPPSSIASAELLAFAPFTRQRVLGVLYVQLKLVFAKRSERDPRFWAAEAARAVPAR